MVYWTHAGAAISHHDVDALLEAAMHKCRYEVASHNVRWEDTVIRLPGRRANFDLEHKPGAPMSFTWLNAVSAVRAMAVKMSKDGYYERSGTIFVGDNRDKVLLAEMALFKDDPHREE